MRPGPALLVLAAAACGAVADLWIAVRPGPSAVDRASLDAARGVVEPRRAPGELVVHSPLFGLPELRGLGDLDATPELPSRRSRAERGIWVIDRADVPMGGFGAPDEVIPIRGPVVVARHRPSDPDAGRLLFDLLDLRDVEVSLERPGLPRVTCDRARPAGGRDCPGQPSWMYVAKARLRIDGRDEVCVWAHPPRRGALRLRVPGAVTSTTTGLPGRRVLTVRSALTDDAVRQTPDGATVATEITQAGRRIGRVVRSNRVGWVERRVVLEPGEPFTLEVSAPKDGRRHHCLRARVVAEPDGEGAP